MGKFVTLFYAQKLSPKGVVKIMGENHMKKISFYVPTDILDICDRNLERADVKSRNQFLMKAVKFYETYLDKDNLSEVLTPAFESVIRARLDLTEHRLSSTLFKLTVEISMLMNILAAAYQLEPGNIQALKHRVINDIKSMNGRLDLEEIIKYQSGES